MAQHAPAPWTLNMGGPVSDWPEVKDAEGRVALRAYGPNAEGTARVAAAAPGLLAALRRLEFAARARESVMGDLCRLLEARAELDAAAKAARAEIAKAEGRDVG